MYETCLPCRTFLGPPLSRVLSEHIDRRDLDVRGGTHVVQLLQLPLGTEDSQTEENFRPSILCPVPRKNFVFKDEQMFTNWWC